MPPEPEIEIERPVSDDSLSTDLPEAEYSLEQLLAGVRPDNLHDEVQTGEAVGEEIGLI